MRASRPTRDTSRVGTGRESGTLGDPRAPHVAAGESRRDRRGTPAPPTPLCEACPARRRLAASPLRRRAPPRGDGLRTSTTPTGAAAPATIASQAGRTTVVAMTEPALARAAGAIGVGTGRYIESGAAPDGAINTLVTVEVEREAK